MTTCWTFSQDTIQQFCISRNAVENIVKDDKKCENLKVAYQKQQTFINNMTQENLIILQKNDSINQQLNQRQNDIKKVQKQLKKQRKQNFLKGGILGVITGLVLGLIINN